MTTPGATKRGDFFYDAFFSGGIGASVVAVVLLAFDVVRGEPFQTPTLLGALLFTDLPASQVTEVRLDLVAYATIAHYLAFAVLGVVVSALLVYVRALRGRTILLTILLFLVLEGGIRLIAAAVAPGLLEGVGPGRILATNLIAALTMGGFLAYSHREDSAVGSAKA